MLPVIRLTSDIAGAVDRRDSPKQQILEIGAERVIVRDVDRVGPLAGRLGDDVEHIVDNEGVVAEPALQGVGAEAADQDVVAAAAAEQIGLAVAGDDIGEDHCRCHLSHCRPG
jgi:hypothetical protein